jgi:hypothetical protein
MDEVRIWNITLDAATILANYSTPYCDVPAGLVAYYKFDQGIGGGDNQTITTLTDAAGPNEGALSGFALIGSGSNFVGGAILGTQVSGTLCPDESYSFNGQELTEPGTYTATFPVPGSCDSTVVLTLTETTVNVGVVQNANLLISQATVGATYQWINCATNAPIPGATAVYYAATAVGEYAVIVAQNGCTDTSACLNVTTIGMEELELPSVRVWPQPASDRLNVELACPLNEVELRISDLTGRVVIRRSMRNTQRAVIDVADLRDGVYILEMQSGDRRRAIRFVKE